MKLFMKILLVIFLMFQSSVFAKTFDVLVLPADLLVDNQNYYGFDEVSKIIADDVISLFIAGSGINSYDLYEVRQKLASNSDLKNTVSSALLKFKNSGHIDYAAFKKISEDFKCYSILIISSDVISNHNGSRRGLWEVLDISSAGSINYPFKLSTNAVLLDDVNDLVMWSNIYTKNVSNNEDVFSAKNYVEANSYLENIRMYSRDIISKDIAQNVTLRFFPKSIRPIDKKYSNSDDGGILRYEKNIPSTQTEKTPQKPDDYYGEMIFGI